MLGVIAGKDERDSTCAQLPVPDYVADLDAPIKPLRIGVCEAHYSDGLDSSVCTAVRAAVDALAQDGAEIVPIDLPHMCYSVACYYVIATAEASSNLARFDGVRYGRRSESASDIAALYNQSRGEGLGPEVKRRILLGTFALSSGYYDAYYAKALKVRTLIRNDFDRAFEKVDVIASPVAPTTAFAIGEKVDDPLSMYLSDTYTIAANLAGHCAISLPCGLDPQGLPIGLQLAAPPFEESKLLNVAHRLQCITDHHSARPPIATERVP
jgi:aspartyl-tRNA(Asn)/glutamyl-tRNA(Gln) amidotransferase subunit A